MRTDGGVTIAPLWRHLELVPLFASIYEQAWPEWYGPDGPGNAVETLRAASRRAGLPAGFVALVGARPAGTVILANDSAVGRRYPGPWVSSLYVEPEFRSRGVAARLIAAAEDHARSLGIEAVYIGVTDLEGAVLKRGYVPLSRELHGDADVAILVKRTGTNRRPQS